MPQARVVGLDGDPDVLALSAAKARDAGVELELVEDLAHRPPFPVASFDRVLSSLVFHHLAREDKAAAFSAIHALLRPGGELHVADWGRARNAAMRAAFAAVQLLDGFRTTSDNVRGRLVPMMEAAGFEDVTETHREMTLLGTFSLYRARRGRGSPTGGHPCPCGWRAPHELGVMADAQRGPESPGRPRRHAHVSAVRLEFQTHPAARSILLPSINGGIHTQSTAKRSISHEIRN